MRHPKPNIDDLHETDALNRAAWKLDILDRLYEILRWPSTPGYCPLELYPCILSRNSRTRNPWAYYPTLNDRESIGRLKYRLKKRIGEILCDLAVGDPLWAIGGSKRLFDASPVFQFEVDFELPAGQVTDEAFALERINMELVNFLRERGITPYFMLSGNRSVYTAFYSVHEIRKEIWLAFYEAVRRILIIGGRNDVNLLKGAGLRYPLSRHYKTGRLCRFIGNLTEGDVLGTLQSIRKDDINDKRLKDVIIEIGQRFPTSSNHILSISGQILPLSGYKDELDPPKLSWESVIRSQRKARKSPSMRPLWEAEEQIPRVNMMKAKSRELDSLSPLFPSLPPAPLNDIVGVKVNEDTVCEHPEEPEKRCSPMDIRNFAQVAGNSHADPCGRGDGWSRSHPRRKDFERYLAEGIPEGQSIQVLLHTDFVKYVCHKFNSSELAEQAVRRTLTNGCEPKVAEERSMRLRSRLDYIGFRPACTRRHSSSWRDVSLAREENDWLDMLRHYLERHSRKYGKATRGAYLQTAAYILRMCRLHPQGAEMGPANLAKEFGWGLETCKKRFRIFRYDFPIVRESQASVAGLRRTVYIRAENLPCLDEDYKPTRPAPRRRLTVEDIERLVSEMTDLPDKWFV